MNQNPLTDFRVFLILLWDFLGLPSPTDAQLDYAYYLQHGGSRKIGMAFRGFGKSWIAAGYALWKLLIDPNEKILVESASKQRAQQFTQFCLQIINGWDLLEALRPGPGMRESSLCFDVGPCNIAQSPSLQAKGIFGQMAGDRSTLIIADDVEIPGNSATVEARAALLTIVSEFEALLVPDVPSEIVVLGTPQSIESIYNVLHGERHYGMRVWPAQYPKPELLHTVYKKMSPVYAEKLLENPELAGRALDPQRFDDEELAKRKAHYGRTGYMLQFMLDTTLSDALKYPLKLADLVVSHVGEQEAPVRFTWGKRDRLDYAVPGFSGDGWYSPMRIDEEWRPYERRLLCIDPSGRGEDKTSYCVLGYLYGYIYLLEQGGLDGGYDETTLMMLTATAKHFNVDTVLIEGNFGDGMFTELLKPVLHASHRCGIEEIKHWVQKEKRIIDTIEPVMNQHKLVIQPSVIEEDMKVVSSEMIHSLFFQMTHINKERGAIPHDDAIDCLAMGIRYLVDLMGRDNQKAIKMQQDRETLKMIQEALDDAVSPMGSERAPLTVEGALIQDPYSDF